MDSLVLDLQKSTLDSNIPASDLLRMALVVARKLDIEELQRWIECELKGYHDAPIPDYRTVCGTPVAFNQYRGWERVMTHLLDPELAQKISEFHIPYPIGELEADLRKDRENGSFLITYPKVQEAILIKALNYPATPAVQVSGSQFHRILDAVRNIILEWALKMEKDGILGEGMTFSKAEKEVASSTVYNVENLIMSSNAQIQKNTQHSNQTLNIGAIDLDALGKVLHTLKEGLPELDLPKDQKSELESEIRTLDAQLESPKPKSVVIRESLRSTRNILEGAVGSALATGVIYEIIQLLK